MQTTGPRALLALTALAAFAAPATAAAQTPAQPPVPAVVHVRVLDPRGAPIEGVTLTILRSRIQAMFTGLTNAAGQYTFTFVPDSAHYELVARKIGYVQTARLVPAGAGDTVSLGLSMIAAAALPRTLDTVRTRANANAVESYFIDSTAIAASRRSLLSAFDVALKLRPNMLGDVARGCTPSGEPESSFKQVPLHPNDGPPPRRGRGGRGGRGTAMNPNTSSQPMVTVPNVTLENVWVNGERVSFNGRDSTIPDILPESLLARIKPDHIAAMEYVNCWDNSMPGLGGKNAVFIELKPGYAFDYKRGSYQDTSAWNRPGGGPVQ